MPLQKYHLKVEYKEQIEQNKLIGLFKKHMVIGFALAKLDHKKHRYFFHIDRCFWGKDFNIPCSIL